MNAQTLPTQFGIFYPTGYTVVAIANEDNARKVQQDLITGGYDETDCRLALGDEVASVAQGHIDNAGIFGKLGMSDELERQHIAAAKRGCAFLLIYTPHDVDADRAMRVVHRVEFELAHRYHRLAIEVLH